MRYHHFEMLPEDAFQHCGNRKIQLHGGGNPFSFIGDAISSIGNAFEDVIGAVGDGLAGLDDWVREEIPGGWLLPVAAVAAVATGGGSLVALGEAAAVEGGAAAAGGVGGVAGATASSIAGGTLTAAQAAELAGLGASSVTSSVGAANLAAGAASGAYGSTVASLVAAGMPASMAMALPSVSTLASNAAVNAAMQMATTGKVNVDSLVKSLAMGSVSSVAGAGVSSAVGSLGIDNPLLASIANSAAQGATGAALSGRNPVTAALASALAGGVGFATQSSGLSQTAINSTVNALASGQSVQNALISAAIATGSSEVKNQIKGFFVDIGTSQGKTKEEVVAAYDNTIATKKEQDKFLDDNKDTIKQIQDDQTFLGSEDNRNKIVEFQDLQDIYNQQKQAYEDNKNIYNNYDAEMRSRGYEQFKDGEGDPLYGPNGWAQKTGGHDVWNDETNSWQYEPDSRYEDGDSIKFIAAPGQQTFMEAANSSVRAANVTGEKLSKLYTDGGVNNLIEVHNRLDKSLKNFNTIYTTLDTATRDAITTLNGFVPPEKIADFINTETATQAEEKTTDEATKAKIAADAEAERVRLQAEADAKNKETTEVIPEVTPEVTPEVKPEPKPSDNFIDPSKDDFRMPITDEEKKAYQDFADQTNPTKVPDIVGGGDTTETPITPAPDQGEVPPPPPVEPPPVETKPTEPNPPVVEPKHDPATDPNYCGPGWHWDGTKCVIDGEEPKPDIPDCGPGMVWSLTDNACVPVTDITPPVVTPITPKPPVTPPVVPVKPVVPAVDPAIAAAQTQQNQQNALLMGLLLGQQQQAPQQQQPASLVKIDKPFDWNQDILGAADYEKATQRPYAAGGSVHSINDELLKMLRS